MAMSKNESRRRKSASKKRASKRSQVSKKAPAHKASCNAEKVQKCVDQGKYCNVDTDRCVEAKSVKERLEKNKSLVADPKYGVFGKKQAVANIQKYLKHLNSSEEQHLGHAIGQTPSPSPVPAPAPIPAPKKASKKPKAGGKKKKQCTEEECEAEGKICNPDTGNCIKDTAANRKKVGLGDKKSVAKPKAGGKKKQCTEEECEAEGKICNPDTGNCIKDTAANRKKVGLGAKKPVHVVATPEQQAPSKKVNYSAMLVKDLKAELKKRGLPMNGVKADLVKRLEKNDKPLKKAIKKTEKKIASDYSKMTVVQLRAELKKRGLPISGVKDKLVKKLEDNDLAKAEQAVEAPTPSPSPVPSPTPSPVPSPSPSPVIPSPSPSPEENCLTKGCGEDEVCNVNTKKCVSPEKAKVKNLHMLTYKGQIYYGSKPALEKFAKEMKIKKPRLHKATKKRMHKKLLKGKKAPPPPPSLSPEESETEKEEETPAELNVEQLIEEPEVEEPETLAEVIHEVSAEKPLTKEQQEMVEKIRKCIGI